MITCEYCRDQLLDVVYGLLEGSELQEVREHLSGCSACQAVLEKVQTEQKLLARAARAITEVNEFALPVNEPATVILTPAAATHPFTPVSRWRQPWLVWSAVAALLIAVSASVSTYRYNVHGYQEVLAEKQQEHKKLAEQFEALPAKYEKLHQAAVKEARGNAGPYVHAVGPTTLQRGAKGHLHITTRNIDGSPAPSNLRIKLAETANGNKVVQLLRLQADRDGQAVAELDAERASPNSPLSVSVEAEFGDGLTRIQEPIRLLAATYVSRIDTNKIAYQVKDVLFFRVLVLDRYSLRPPSESIPMRVELLNVKGESLRSIDMSTGAGGGGILASEFAIDEKFQPGQYTLNVQPIDAAKTDVQPATQRLEFVRELPGQDLVRFDKDSYLPGDKVSGTIRVQQSLANRATIDGQQVPLTSERQYGGFGGGFSAPGAIAGASNSSEKNKNALNAVPMQRFAAAIPQNLRAGTSGVQMVVPVQDGKKKTEIYANIPIGPTDFTIDCFPEGGDLIANVQNRVFYRVRSKSGEPVTGEGQVMLLSGKNDIVDSSYQLGMGYLDFVPKAKETYTIRITTPTKIENLSAPFANLGIRTEGVVIQVADELAEDRPPSAVGMQGDPIRFTLRQQGPPRKLLLVAQCRGQIVDQRWVQIKQGSIDLTLQPTPDAVGMIRVTAYELQDNRLQPIAERLVYRTAAHRLDLGFEPNTQQLLPGRSVSAKTSARDEKGRPVAAWFLASIIDERFQTRPRSLSAHFYLLNEIRTGADLDDAQLILHDSAESVQMLERFLGTHGWRRFLPKAQGQPSLGFQPLVFSRENQSLDVLQQQYEERLVQALKPIHVKGFVEKIELEGERSSAAEAVALAASNLRRFEENVHLGIGLALRLVLVALLATSLILMVIGTYRIARAQKVATPAFGLSFGCLVGCLLVLLVGNWLGAPNLTPLPSLAAAHGPAGWEVGRDLDHQFAQMPPVSRNLGERPVTGVFKEQIAKLDEGKREKIEKEADSKAARAMHDQLAQSFFRRTRGDNDAFADRKENRDSLALNESLKKAYDAAEKLHKKADAGPPPAPLAPKEVRGGAGAENAKAKAGRQVEYAPVYAAGLQTDTLLWHPSLWLANGGADVHFNIGSGDVTYRVLLLGHSPTGRFGFYEQRLDVRGR